MKKRKTDIEMNPALLNVIAPQGIHFHRSNLELGEMEAKGYGIVRYPQAPDYGWLANITTIPSTLVEINYTPQTDGEMLDNINSNISKKRQEALEAKSDLIRQRAEAAVENGRRLLEQIDLNGESVGMMGMCIMPMAADSEEFTKVDRKMKSICSTAQLRPRVLAHKQKGTFKMLSPTHIPDKDVSMIVDRPMPLRTIVGGFPFAASGLNDGSGYYLGHDKNGNIIIVDPWMRAGDRTNTNFFVEGVPGVGKTTIIKDIIISEYMKGNHVIIFDPQGEYKDLVKALRGDWINAGGSAMGKINPLQIRPVPVDTDDKNDFYAETENGMGDLAVWMKHLEVFFNIRWRFTPEKMAILKKNLLEVYNEFGINWDTRVADMSAEEFPTLTDVYDHMQHRKDAAEDEEERRDYRNILMQLEDAVNGSDSFLWNGHSTVREQSRVLCFDTSALNDFSDEVKCAQYNNLFTYSWQLATADRKTRYSIVVDEAYLLADRKVPQSLAFLRNTMKQDRKYEVGMFVITHSVVDFMADEIKQYGQAIMDIPTYKILMGTDGQNLKDLKELYNLTEAEETLLSSKQRGHALFMVGAKRMHAVFDIPEYKMEMMGTGGGR